jgi:hypothetical protein
MALINPIKPFVLEEEIDFETYVNNLFQNNILCSVHSVSNTYDRKILTDVACNYTRQGLNILTSTFKKNKCDLSHLITFINDIKNKIKYILNQNYETNKYEEYIMKDVIEIICKNKLMSLLLSQSVNDIHIINKLLTALSFQKLNKYVELEKQIEDIIVKTYSDQIITDLDEIDDIMDMKTKYIYMFKNNIKYFLQFQNLINNVIKNKDTELFKKNDISYVVDFASKISVILNQMIRNKLDIIFILKFIKNFSYEFKRINYEYIKTDLEILQGLCQKYEEFNILIDIVENIPKDNFVNLKTFQKNITNTIIHNPKYKISKDNILLLINKINTKIINKKNIFNEIIQLKYYSDKDYVLKQLELNLVKRIIYTKFDYEYEKSLLKILNRLGEINSYKAILEDFKNIQKTDNTTFHTLSFDIYPIMTNTGYILLDDITRDFPGYDLIKNYGNKVQYKDNIFYAHLGQTNIIYNDEFKTLYPSQFFALQLDEDIFRYLFRFYEEEYVNNVLKSIKYIDSTDNLIDIFNNLDETESKEQQKIEQELTLSREEILMANINSIIKTNEYQKEELFEVLTAIINVFKLEVELYEQVIETMIKKDYIYINDNKIYKEIF